MSMAISVQDIGKQYWRASRATHENSLREALIEGARGLLTRKSEARPSKEGFWALKDVSFGIKHGENVGIIGMNGAGKSTLLKLISRIAAPTTGSIRLVGRVGALLEVGTGFHRELTGRENIFLYGSILGMHRHEIAEKFEAIVEFSEIGDFIDMPVKRYSSGMYVRLAFSVAAHLEPDILLLDEVLAVGDYTFQKKCIDFARRLQTKGSTILLVSHNMFSVKTMCERVIYIKNGRVAFDGPTDEGLRHYEQDSYLAPPNWFRPETGSPLEIQGIEILDESGAPRTLFRSGERMRVRLAYTTSGAVPRTHLRVSVTRADDLLCCNYSSLIDGVSLSAFGPDGTVEVMTGPLALTAASYTVSVNVVGKDAGRPLAARLGPRFHVADPDLDPDVFGVFHEAGTWHHAPGGA
ncbi:ABC transporter ATP-binding protein [Methylobacterium pseudosasicola]|uniref:Lipopolysaccharide transport system ATP-binding protein n=1 Tax=Methylobacterium pseudosasicola TaxID=582667 RepID=A0A1I4HF21_9HYPH|nr:ABC transporter ATP-binding protein [Methylobacterium pseudosasicola]SFL40898.1 lipopolysaccharide transport system ATP-binding protein [Methylobacterium pseudosasicola]